MKQINKFRVRTPFLESDEFIRYRDYPIKYRVSGAMIWSNPSRIRRFAHFVTFGMVADINQMKRRKQ